MIAYVVDSVKAAGFDKIVLVVGHQAENVRQFMRGPRIEFAVQEPQLGTGHAVGVAKTLFENYSGHVFILCGDIPLIKSSTIKQFIRYHEETSSRLTVMTTFLDDPFGYGRIVRDESGSVVRIVEERDANEEEKRNREINTGIYLVQKDLVFTLLAGVDAKNSQGEYYLTDVVKQAVQRAIPVEAFVLEDAEEASGINTRADLARVSSVIWSRVRELHMASGVTFLNPSSAYIDAQVRIGPDTIVHPSVTISGDSEIGSSCVIESGVYIMNSRLGDRVKVLQGSRIDSATIEDDTSVGPMAHLRPEAKIGKRVKVGNFVEIKKSVLGDGTKASHLTYLGDSIIGKDVNIGCGTITCNYDGKKKHPTIIGDRCFVGSDVQFVAPVEIGESSLIGAGSTITKNVPPQTLAISRAKQKMYPLRRGQGPKREDEDRES
jgi:bifunctional UDP-N-acetylglucosamine pyrophosphorylase/glucosamine-1-phosphate N-acetyltransferase